MAKKRVQVETEAGSAGNDAGSSVASYFRAIFEANPQLLKRRSNDTLVDQWAADHPDDPEMPQRIKYIMSNTKSLMRKKLRKRKGKKQPAAAVAWVSETESMVETPAAAGYEGLELLEEKIDDCMTLAKNLDRQGLAGVIELLRRGRNEVVWKIGQ
jgi:hypothetical protein